MANRERGEIAVDVEGVPYRLQLTFNSCCEVEDLIGGQSFDWILQQTADGRLSGLRAGIWCVLQEHHAAEIKTLRDAGRWIERAGGYLAALKIFDRAITANMDGGTETADPPSAQDGTGASSTPELAVPA